MKHILLVLIVPFLACGSMKVQQNDVSKGNNGAHALFDGKSLDGWRGASRDTPPEAAWAAEKGILTFDPSKGHGGDIITKSSFKDFELSVDFNVSEGGNSGIKYFIFPNSSLGCEYQIIDDLKHADASLGKNGNRKTGSLYDVLPADPKKKYRPAGQWNTARIVAKGHHVEHWLNGFRVLEYERGSEQFKQAITESKFKNNKGFGEVPATAILLQAHGDKVSFRNIKIKEL
jgi:hypothetical protein